MLDIEKVLRDCEMDRDNELQIYVKRGVLLCRFLKSFQKALQHKEKGVIDISWHLSENQE